MIVLVEHVKDLPLHVTLACKVKHTLLTQINVSNARETASAVLIEQLAPPVIAVSLPSTAIAPVAPSSAHNAAQLIYLNAPPAEEDCSWPAENAQNALRIA